MDVTLKNQIKAILISLEQNGLTWKTGKDKYHLSKRKNRQYVPYDWEMQDYITLIMNILTDKENDNYIYFKESFNQNYFVFADENAWIVIIGENGIIETAIITDRYNHYLDERKGYRYIGKMKDVWQ